MSKTLANLALGISLVSTPVAISAQDPAKGDPNEIVCKREKKVNSRFTTKTCRSRAEWSAMAEQNKRDFGETRDRPSIDIRRDQ